MNKEDPFEILQIEEPYTMQALNRSYQSLTNALKERSDKDTNIEVYDERNKINLAYVSAWKILNAEEDCYNNSAFSRFFSLVKYVLSVIFFILIRIILIIFYLGFTSLVSYLILKYILKYLQSAGIAL